MRGLGLNSPAFVGNLGKKGWASIADFSPTGTTISASSPYGLAGSVDGLNLMDKATDDYESFLLGTAGDLSTASLTGQYTGYDGTLDFTLKDDGTLLWVSDGNGRYIYQRALSTPYDADTISQDGTSNYLGIGSVYGLWVSRDGHSLYIIDSSRVLSRHELSPAWDVLNFPAASESVTLLSSGDTPIHIQLSPDETILWVRYGPSGGGNSRIAEFPIPTVRDVSSMSSQPDAELTYPNANYRGFFRTEQWMAVANEGGNEIVEFAA